MAAFPVTQTPVPACVKASEAIRAAVTIFSPVQLLRYNVKQIKPDAAAIV